GGKDVKDDPDALKLIRTLQAAMKKNKVHVMTETEEEQYEEALHAFVGGVLKRMLQLPPEEA
ncbi:hypothetical protein V5O48_019229, partial [Marasmius crinis-equi]